MPPPPSPSAPLLLPVGTQVVTRIPLGTRPAGLVGRVVEPPVDGTHSYKVELAGGEVVALKRGEVGIFKEHQKGGLTRVDDQLAEFGVLSEHVVYRCVIGSRAYGLATETSDTDRRGVYLPPADLHWSLYGVPEQIESDATQECYWELQKFLQLALKGNPNILECLYTPLVERAAPIAREMLAMRGRFLSKLVYQTFNGYAMSQFKKIEGDMRGLERPGMAGPARAGAMPEGELRFTDSMEAIDVAQIHRLARLRKHAMHLVRLLLSGIAVMRTGELPVRVEGERDRLLAVRSGDEPWEKVDAWRLELHRDFEAAYAVTKLPERPDYEAADGLLRRARRAMV